MIAPSAALAYVYVISFLRFHLSTSQFAPTEEIKGSKNFIKNMESVYLVTGQSENLPEFANHQGC